LVLRVFLHFTSHNHVTLSVGRFSLTGTFFGQSAFANFADSNAPKTPRSISMGIGLLTLTAVGCEDWRPPPKWLCRVGR